MKGKMKKKLVLGASIAAVVGLLCILPVTVSGAEVHPTEGNYVKFNNPDPSGNAENNNYIDIGVNLYDMGLTDTATIEAWVYSNENLVNRDVISDWASNVGLTLRASTNIEAYVYPEDSRIGKTEPQKIFVEKWHHLALVLDGDIMIGYVDGEEIASVTLKQPIGDSPATLKIGMRGDGGNKFYGSVSDVRIWNVARTEEEINANKDKRLTGTEEGLIAYWKLDEASGDKAIDSAGNYDGTLVGCERVINQAQEPSQPDDTNPDDTNPDDTNPPKTGDFSSTAVLILGLAAVAGVKFFKNQKVKS